MAFEGVDGNQVLSSRLKVEAKAEKSIRIKLKTFKGVENCQYARYDSYIGRCKSHIEGSNGILETSLSLSKKEL